MDKKSYIIIGSVILVIVVITTIGSIWAASSLWFMWELLPQSKQSTVALNHHPVLDQHLEEFDLTGWDLPYYPLVKRLAYDRANEGEVLVALPQFRYQSALRGQLEADGWHVKRIGLLLLAKRGNNVQYEPSIKGTSKRYISRIINGKLPINPLFIVAVDKDSQSYFDRDLFGVGSANSQTISMQFAFGGSDLSNIDESTISEHERISYDSLSLYVPANRINMLSEDRIQAINKLLRQKIGFTYTEPHIVSHLIRHDFLLLELSDSKIILGIDGEPEDFVEHMMGLVKTEDTYTRPITKAFRLPDGSLGYEKVPGEMIDIFKEDSTCIETIDVEMQVSLCLKDDRSIISTDKEDVSKYLTKDFRDTWNVEMGSEFTKMLGLNNIEYLRASGNGGHANIELVIE